MRKYPYIKLYLSVPNIYIAFSIDIPFLEQNLIFIPKPVVSFANERTIEFLPCDCHFLFEITVCWMLDLSHITQRLAELK